MSEWNHFCSLSKLLQIFPQELMAALQLVGEVIKERNECCLFLRKFKPIYAIHLIARVLSYDVQAIKQ